MKKLFKSLILLNAIFVSIIAGCPEYPTIPTTTPLLITPSSPGVSNFPPSTTKLSISMVITPHECPAGAFIPLFTLSNLNSGSGTREYFQIQLWCDPYAIVGTYDDFDGGFLWGQEIYDFSASSSDRPFAFFLSFNLDNGPTIQIDAESDTNILKATFSSPGYPVAPFDANSEFYLCADKEGASPTACTVSQFIFEYRYYADVDGSSVPYGHLGGTSNPTIASFYPLLDGSLAPSVGSASSAYFGDKASSPTTGTSPTWDSSKDLVTITAGQFLTFPLPSFASGNLEGSQAFGFAAWIKISSLSADPSTLFAMHSAAGSQVGYSLKASSSTRKISLAFGTHDVTMSSNPTVVLNEWKLFGFTAYLTAGKTWTEAMVFFGTDTASFSVKKDGTNFPTTVMNDLSTASVIRVGDATNSFSGQVSFVNMLTPGGGFVKTSDLCSSTSSLELGVGSFSVACSGTNTLNPVDSTCYATCPSGSRSRKPSFTGAPASVCVDCPKSHCSTCDETNCLTCVTSYFLNDGDCVKPCPEGKYSDGSACQICPSSHCKTCDSTKCLSCDSGYILSGGSCSSSSGGVSCSDGTYLDGSTCKDCSSDCKTCSSSSSCSVCNSGFQLYKAGCVGTCPSKTYKNGSTCKDCASDCLTCDSTGCLTCPSGFTVSGGSCISLCGDKMYYDGSTCQNCPTDCKTCDANQCYTCDSGFLLYDGDCVGSCPAKTYQSGSTCIDCSSNCLICDNSQCLTCDSSYLSYKGGCVSTCPAKTYSDLTSCITCPSHCAECDADGCKACENGYKLGTDNTCKAITVISSGSGLSGGAIAGIVVGSLLVIGTASWIFYIFLKKSSLTLFKKNGQVRPFEVQTPSDIGVKTIASPTNNEAKALIV